MGTTASGLRSGMGGRRLTSPMRPPHLAPPHRQAEFAALLELYHGCQRERDVTCGRARRLTLVPASIAVTLAQRERHKDLLVALGQKVCPIIASTLYTRMLKMDARPEVQLFEFKYFLGRLAPNIVSNYHINALYKDAKNGHKASHYSSSS